jgi:hypothetical protein
VKDLSDHDPVIPNEISVIPNKTFVIPNKMSVIPNKISVIPNEVRDLGFAATAKRPAPRPISSIPIPKREARSPEHQKK